MGAEGYAIHLVTYQQTSPLQLLDNCIPTVGCRQTSKREAVISRLNTAWMSSRANSLLWLDVWQENRAPHLRCPFDDFSLPIWPAAAWLRVDEPFHWHVRSAWGQLSAALQTCAPSSLSHEDVVAIWRNIQLLTAARLFVLLHLSFLLTFSVWLLKRKARGIHIPIARGQREKGSYYHMPAGSRTDLGSWKELPWQGMETKITP